MGLLSIFQRNKQDAAKPAARAKSGRGGKSPARQAPLANASNPADTAEAMREVRARARTRLMGATVLLLVGVIGFPLLFETQPRPIPVDLPIEIPARNAPGVAEAGAHASHGTAIAAATGSLAASGPTPESVSYDARPSAPLPAAASTPASEPAAHRSAFASLASALTSSSASNSETPAAPVEAPPAKPTAKPAKPAPKPETAAPATHTAGPVLPPVASKPSPAAILADTGGAKPADAAPAGGRFVIQVGAFLDDAKVRETRGKVEKLGLKTYTQGVDTPTGKRIRVRVGPVATKAEADKIAARLKGDGLQAVVLSL